MWEYNYLAHDGQKGMHWGERKYQYQDGTYTPLGLMRRRAEYRAQRRQARREERASRREARRAERERSRRTSRSILGRTDHMSDEELRSSTDRLRLENDYIQALESRHSGQVFVRDTLRQIGKNAATAVATRATNVAVDALVRQFGVATADMEIGSLGRSFHDAAVASTKGKGTS